MHSGFGLMFIVNLFSACPPLFGKLLIDFFSVKEILGIQPAHVTLVLRLKRIVANTHDVEIASADFYRQRPTRPWCVRGSSHAQTDPAHRIRGR